MAISEEKLQLYIVAIVGVVAAVGILVLLMNTGAVSGETDDLTGQVVSTCCAGHNDNNGNFVKNQFKNCRYSTLFRPGRVNQLRLFFLSEHRKHQHSTKDYTKNYTFHSYHLSVPENILII